MHRNGSPKIEKGNSRGIPIYEPSPDKLVARNLGTEWPSFTAESCKPMPEADVMWYSSAPTRLSGATTAMPASPVYAPRRARFVAALKGFTMAVTKPIMPIGSDQEVECHRTDEPEADFVSPEVMGTSKTINPEVIYYHGACINSGARIGSLGMSRRLTARSRSTEPGWRISPSYDGRVIGPRPLIIGSAFS